MSRFDEKGNLEILLFTIQSKMRANNQRPYLPKEGKMLSDINNAWERLDKAEHERELSLREELIRLVHGWKLSGMSWILRFSNPEKYASFQFLIIEKKIYFLWLIRMMS